MGEALFVCAFKGMLIAAFFITDQMFAIPLTKLVVLDA
jgi:hypothetical protein